MMHLHNGEDSSVVPVVRWAILVGISPPPQSEVEDILAKLKENWSKVSPSYRRMVAATAGVAEEDLFFVPEETVRIGRDGKTPMIDFPRLRTTDTAARSFDTRICIAICTDELSSKVWSRVGVPLRETSSGQMISSDGAEINLSGLQDKTSFYRSLSQASARWAHQMLKKVLTRHFPQLKSRRSGSLEVSVMGTDDNEIASLLEQLANPDTSVQKLLAQPGASGRFSKYFQGASSLESPLEEIESRDPEAFWFSSPTTIELENGDLETREVLFLMRPTENAAQAVGVGFDGNAHRNLALRSALKVSRWISNRI